jgi:hypothetical protein
MRTFVLVYVALGVVIGAVLFGWAAVSSVRRHGLRSAVRAGVREALDDPPLLGTFAWLCVLAFPLLFVVAVATDGFDLAGAVAFLLVWLVGLALLRRQLRRRAGTPRR